MRKDPKSIDTLSGNFFVGKVVDNNDPEKLGRCRVMIDELFEGIEVDHLPWIMTSQPIARGGGEGIGSVNVPRVDSRVICMFDGGDTDSGVALGQFVDGANKADDELDVDYPDSYGYADENGTKIVTNAKQGTIHVHHKGTDFNIGADGGVTVDSPADISVSSGGDITITASGNITLNGARIDFNP